MKKKLFIFEYKANHHIITKIRGVDLESVLVRYPLDLEFWQLREGD